MEKLTNCSARTGLRTFYWQQVFIWLWWWLPHAQVVETSVTTTDNSPSQDYTHPDDHTTLWPLPNEINIIPVQLSVRLCEISLRILEARFACYFLKFSTEFFFGDYLFSIINQIRSNLNQITCNWLVTKNITLINRELFSLQRATWTLDPRPTAISQTPISTTVNCLNPWVKCDRVVWSSGLEKFWRILLIVVVYDVSTTVSRSHREKFSQDYTITQTITLRGHYWQIHYIWLTNRSC